MMSIKRGLNRLLREKTGYRVVRDGRKQTKLPSATSELSSGRLITNLDGAAVEAGRIPGMTTGEAGKILYSLCMSQSIKGNVVEIGSWQGRSTSFLARACRDAGNGRLFAIDHFKGNVGKEEAYAVGRSDLSDLQECFEKNMETVGLREHITLLPVASSTGVAQLEGPLRFVFIDGDHTREGVMKDVQLVKPLLAEQAIIAFDDFCPRFQGVIQTANEFLAEHPNARAFNFGNTLVVML